MIDFSQFLDKLLGNCIAIFFISFMLGLVFLIGVGIIELIKVLL
jgi:hypothetical protein